MNMVICLDGAANGRYIDCYGIAVGETILVDGLRYRLDDQLWLGEQVLVCDVLFSEHL